MKWHVGDIRVTRIQEIVFPKFSDVIPAATPEVVKQIKWLFPHFDLDSEQAIETRRKIFGEYADTPTLIIGTHFAGPTAGTLISENGSYRLQV